MVWFAHSNPYRWTGQLLFKVLWKHTPTWCVPSVMMRSNCIYAIPGKLMRRRSTKRSMAAS